MSEVLPLNLFHKRIPVTDVGWQLVKQKNIKTKVDRNERLMYVIVKITVSLFELKLVCHYEDGNQLYC
jgi:hypothetical protein